MVVRLRPCMHDMNTPLCRTDRVVAVVVFRWCAPLFWQGEGSTSQANACLVKVAGIISKVRSSGTYLSVLDSIHVSVQLLRTSPSYHQYLTNGYQ